MKKKTMQNIKNAWESLQIVKCNLERTTRDFKRAAAVIGEWLGVSGLQFEEPDVARKKVLTRMSQDLLFKQASGQPDHRSEELLKWFDHMWEDLDSVKSALVYWKTVFRNHCAKDGLDPKEVEAKLAEEWRAQLFGEEKK